MEELDPVERLTTKLFEIKADLKEGDYLIIMNAAKDIANARNPKLPHRLYCTITTLFTSNECPETHRTCFYLRILLNEELDYMAFDDEAPIRLKHLIKDMEGRLCNILQTDIIASYYSKHFKEMAEIIRQNEVIEDVKVDETKLEYVFIRKERENEQTEPMPYEPVVVFYPPPHPTHGEYVGYV